MKTKNYLLIFGLVFASVITTYFATHSTAQQQTAIKSEYEYQIAAILFQQKASEYRALCLQAFNWAKIGIDADDKSKKKLPKIERKKPRAIVVDIDETMLDNSPAQAISAKNNLPFELKSWYAWGEMRKAKAIPGAVDFANYAKEKNVRIFYVSNRDKDPQLQATIDNLKAVGFPDITSENVLLRVLGQDGKPVSTKEPRRDDIEKTYRIVSLIGDNLNDLSDVFENKSVMERFAETDKAKNLWGNKFIVIPNAMYGEWESAIYRDDTSKNPRTEKRANALELP
ncbi:MAG TPA: 5'-nucleotidase, lipoprotein e(P4) family [Pyrinomonadaceae bacterium]|nr:5'-nucleotidase, lipoprotein e(P4) family [Pyrinomonadaceae bacterium]